MTDSSKVVLPCVLRYGPNHNSMRSSAGRYSAAALDPQESTELPAGFLLAASQSITRPRHPCSSDSGRCRGSCEPS